MELLTNSRARSARACLRHHDYRYEQGIVPIVEDDNLSFGTLIHHALEAWWTAPLDQRLDRALLALDHHADKADPYAYARAEVMICGYHSRWSAEPYETLAVEVTFRAPLVNPASGRSSRTFELGGKIDAIVRDLRGRTLLVEHKTAAGEISLGSTYWQRLRLDSQISTYYRGAEALGYAIDGCLYDVLGKPAQRPLKATPEEARKFTKDGKLYANQRLEDEAPSEYRARVVAAVAEEPDAYFVRGEVVRLEEDLEEAAVDAWLTAEYLRESRAAGRAPRNPDACFRYNRACEYLDVCSKQARIDDPARFRIISDVHPELGSPIVPPQ